DRGAARPLDLGAPRGVGRGARRAARRDRGTGVRPDGERAVARGGPGDEKKAAPARGGGAASRFSAARSGSERGEPSHAVPDGADEVVHLHPLISGDLEVRREVAQIVDHRRLPLPRGTSPRPMAGPQGGELVVVALQVPDALGHDSTPGCPAPAGPAPAEPEKGRKKGAPEAPQVYSAAAATRGQAPPPP